MDTRTWRTARIDRRGGRHAGLRPGRAEGGVAPDLACGSKSVAIDADKGLCTRDFVMELRALHVAQNESE